MSTIIDHNEVFPEEGTRGIEVTFKDSNGDLTIPNSVQWSLTTAPSLRDMGEVINSRNGVNIAAEDLDTSVLIVVSGADLAIRAEEQSDRYVRRALLVEYNYNDPKLGNNVVDSMQYLFRIENFYNI